MNIIAELEAEQAAKLLAGKTIPPFQPGDTVVVNVKVTEGERTRVQAYEGVCIARTGGGLNESFTVRKISYGEGVERVFPVFSPNIEFDQARAARQGPARQALLSARPAGQVGSYRGKNGDACRQGRARNCHEISKGCRQGKKSSPRRRINPGGGQCFKQSARSRSSDDRRDRETSRPLCPKTSSSASSRLWHQDWWPSRKYRPPSCLGKFQADGYRREFAWKRHARLAELGKGIGKHHRAAVDVEARNA